MSKRKKLYYLIYKPYGVLTQFTPEHGKRSLAEIIKVPKDVYPVGRLDENSEGLLILSNDGEFKHQLLHPHFEHKRTYWAQLDGEITASALQKLQAGVTIRINKEDYTTLPAEVDEIESPDLPERPTRVDFNRSRGDSWIAITLQEGKNRQVRKMTAAVGYPTVRLVRVAIENLSLGKLQPGDQIEFSGNSIKRKLNMLKTET